ncbi:MAG: DNA repair protein RecO [Candidatus Pelagibacter sp.]|nr:DNA repair protein RecO [Candidatus Pelagibacter sp.]OUV86574.1 MAG: DNA repair protein RecO [Pelagibacteraceae bacterium TMED136]|tara:strand:+ start:7456 stop:8082 length:627 start_codon:yes stop_codon:yes gene_type:complete
MRWSDTGYLISISSIKENTSILKIFSENYGCYSGLFFGSSSKKKKPDLQLGNKIKVHYNSKSEDRIGYFSIELIANTSIKFFNENIKLNLLLTSLEVISKVMPDRQTYKGVFDDFDLFIEKLESDNFKPYLIWEFNFLKKMGYGIDLNETTLDSKIKDLLLGKNVDFSFDDLKIIFNLNSQMISDGLVDIINISNFKNRLKILKYLNE